MPRLPSSHSPTTAAAVRRHFGLTQAELGRWLGLSGEQVKAVEAGKRQFSAAATARLGQLADQLPPAGPVLPSPEDAPAPPPARAARAAELLRRRERRCRYLARRLQFQLETLALQDAALVQRRRGLAALHQALPAPQAPADAAWLAGLEAATAAELAARPTPLARAHLALRAHLLLQEAETLAALLANEGGRAEKN